METLSDHVRFALRTMKKNPGFTAATVLSLALGIGANTTIFTLINALGANRFLQASCHPTDFFGP